MKEINDIPQGAGTGDAGTQAPETARSQAQETTRSQTQETTRSQRWEAQKQKEREELEAKYSDAPYLTKIFALHFGRPLVILSVLVALGVLVSAGMKIARNYQEKQAAQTNREEENPFALIDQPLSEEDSPKIYEESPIDEEGAARIDAVAPVNADDTWTICVYMVGSNLEDMDENDLSYVTDVMIADQKEQIKNDKVKNLRSNVKRYSDELAGSGLDLPSYFFYPDKPIASSNPVTEDVIVAESPGSASSDIDEMVAETWSDNIRIVIQTGGAKRWSN